MQHKSFFFILLSASSLYAQTTLTFDDLRLSDGVSANTAGSTTGFFTVSSTNTGTFSSDIGVDESDVEVLPNGTANSITYGFTLSDANIGGDNSQVTFDLVVTAGGSATQVFYNPFFSNDALTADDTRVDFGETLNFAISDLRVDGILHLSESIVFSNVSTANDAGSPISTISSDGIFSVDGTTSSETRLKGFDLQFDVGGAAVPEPATYAALLGLAALIYVSLRKRK